MSNTVRPFEQRREPSTSGSHSSSHHSAHKGSVIGPTLVVKGEVTAEEDLLIMGRVEGTIDHNQSLTIHGDGVVHASIKAQEITVEGTVEGNLYGTKRVKICATGNVTGNVFAPSVGLTEGAAFKGMVDMEPDASKIESKFNDDVGRMRSDAAPAAESAQPEAADSPPQAGEAETGEAEASADSEEAEESDDSEDDSKTPARGKRRNSRGSKAKSDDADDA